MNENCFSNFCEFRLIYEGVASAPTVYSELESVAKLIFSFVPRSFFLLLCFSIFQYLQRYTAKQPYTILIRSTFLAIT